MSVPHRGQWGHCSAEICPQAPPSWVHGSTKQSLAACHFLSHVREQELSFSCRSGGHPQRDPSSCGLWVTSSAHAPFGSCVSSPEPSWGQRLFLLGCSGPFSWGLLLPSALPTQECTRRDSEAKRGSSSGPGAHSTSSETLPSGARPQGR